MDLSMQAKKESGWAMTNSIGLGVSSAGGFSGKIFFSDKNFLFLKKIYKIK